MAIHELKEGRECPHTRNVMRNQNALTDIIPRRRHRAPISDKTATVDALTVLSYISQGTRAPLFPTSPFILLFSPLLEKPTNEYTART